jgi:HAD superfamily hydrolase (TIGR01509 family)
MARIQHIFFDNGEVLSTGFYGTEKRISELVGKTVSNKALKDLPELNDFFLGKITEDELWQRMSDRYGWKVPLESLKAAVRKNFAPIPGTREIIVDLRRRGACRSVNILSNHGKEWVADIESRFNLHTLFDVRHYSCDTGVAKPDPSAFMKLCTEIGAKPSECLFIDDYHVNIAAAYALGFTTRHFTDAKNLRTELRLLGLIH